MTRKEFIQSDSQVVECPIIFKRGPLNLKVKCNTCKEIINISLTAYWGRRKNGPWSCFKCLKPMLIEKAKNNPLYSDSEYKEKFKKLHSNPEYYKKVHNDEVRNKISQSQKAIWQDPSKRELHLRHRRTNKFRRRISEWSKGNWNDPKYRERQYEVRGDLDFRKAASERAKKLWQDPKYRENMIKVLDKARIKSQSFPFDHISSYQLKLYKMLDNLGVRYFKEGPETIVGPIETNSGRWSGYSFDCLVPLEDRKLFIECNSRFTHPESKRPRDIAKATLLTKLVPKSELMTIWDLDFRNPWLLRNNLMRKLGLTSYKMIDYELKDVLIKSINDIDELQRFFGYYHYLANIGRKGSRRYAAYCNGELIAACVFSSPTRNESIVKQGLKRNQLYELTRFCIHPCYQRKNFASWFLGKALKLFWIDEPRVIKIISFADTTYNHQGIIYKATGWKLDGVVRPDYWYQNSDGGYIHKKTVWDLAKKFKLTEHEYANQNKLSPIWGKQKLRYVIAR